MVAEDRQINDVLEELFAEEVPFSYLKYWDIFDYMQQQSRILLS